MTVSASRRAGYRPFGIRRPFLRAMSMCMALTATLGGVNASYAEALSPAMTPSKVYPGKPLKELPSYVGKNCVGWKQLNWPSTAGEKKFKIDGKVTRVYTGGVYNNSPMQDHTKLPNGKYHEYDVAAGPEYGPKGTGARGRHRLVRNDTQGTIYYTDDHYQNFTPVEGGC